MEATESMAGHTPFLLKYGKCHALCIWKYSSVLGDMLGRNTMPGQAMASDTGCTSVVAQVGQLAGLLMIFGCLHIGTVVCQECRVRCCLPGLRGNRGCC